MGAGSSSIHSEMRNVSPAEAKKYMDSASPEDLAAAAAALDEDAKERLLAALQDPELQQSLLFYQEGSASPRDF